MPDVVLIACNEGLCLRAMGEGSVNFLDILTKEKQN